MSTDPTRPIMTREELRRENEIRMQKAQINSYSWPCCLNCENWTDSSEKQVADPTKYSGWRMEPTGPKCMKYDILPPPDVICVGCSDYTPDIPF